MLLLLAAVLIKIAVDAAVVVTVVLVAVVTVIDSWYLARASVKTFNIERRQQ